MTPHYQSRNVLLISISFFFVFAGFTAGQQYLTVLFERNGQATLALISLFLLYGTFMLTGTVTAKMIPLLGGVKKSLVSGILLYVLFIASVAFENTAVLLFFSILMGLGAALVWVSSGQIIADSSSDGTAGRHFSYQIVAQNVGSIAGLAIGAHLMRTMDLSGMYFTLAGIIALGALCAVFIEPVKEEVRDRPFKLNFLIKPKMLALFPLLFGTYFLAGQSFTAMNTVVVSTLGIGSLAPIIGLSKAGNIAGTLASGIAADAWNKSATLIVTVACACIGTVLFTMSASFILMICGAILIGVAIATVYPVCLAWLKERIQPEEYTYALGVFHVYTNIGMTAAIAANMWFTAHVSFSPGVIALLLAIPGILLFSKLTAR